MLRKVVCSMLVAMLLGALLALIPVAPAAHAAEFPPVFSLKWGTSGTGNGQFQSLVGLAVDTAGNVYVTDDSLHRVQKFSSTGTYLTKWGSNGTGNGQFNRPQGVAVDTTGNVYVADTDNHRVQKFTSTGTYLTQWGTYGTGNGQFNRPFYVSVDATGDVYVADTGNHRVQKFSSTGTYLTQWGSNGTGNGQFKSPQGVAVDTPGNVYIADTGNHRVQKFTSAGTYLTQWGTNGTANGQFDYPRGVAVDPTSGNVHVVESGNHRVQRFTSAGTYLTKWGTNGTGNGQFQFPFGVTVDSSGNAYVADWGNYRVQRFVPAAPAVTISKSADESTVVAGSAIHYHVTITNTGNVPLTGVTVTDTKAPACAGSLANIAVGANRVVDCSYTTTPSDIGTYANSATVDTAETDAVTSNTVNVTVTAAAQSESPPQFALTWGTSGSGAGQFSYPEGIVRDAAGNLYVADSFNDRIQKFAADGTFLTQWGTYGTGNGQFNHPHGLAVAGGYVYVGDTSNNRVQKFTDMGTYVTQWGTYGTGNGQFNLPQGVGVDAAGNVFVADWNNHRVQRFTATGTYLGQWGTLGTGNGKFNHPYGVTVDSTDRVWVVDFDNDRVQAFTTAGAFVTKWGNAGTADGQFDRPTFLAVDPTGAVYVADYGNNRIQKFTDTGTFLTKWGTSGTAHGQFGFLRSATGVSVDESGNVWVTDRTNNRVQQFATVPSATEVAPVFVQAWGTPGSGDGQFNNPDAVGVSPVTGDVYVADRGNNRVQQFTREGGFVRTWGTAGTGDGQFNDPTGVAVNAAGDVYVTDKNNSRVQQFTAAGTWVRTFGVGTLWNPEGVAVAPDGTVYVADAGNQRVRKFSATGTLLATIGTSGSANGQLSYAQGVAATDTAVYVADTYNRRVQQFTPTGAYVRGWGVQGAGNGQFQEVDGLAAAGGRVVVTDPNNTRLQTFTGTGTFVTAWGSPGTGSAQFVAPSPADVALTADGWVYVVDRTNHRIQQFAPSVIRGTVTEQGTATPLEGTWVVALRAADYRLLGGTTTAADGSYALPVPAGGYKLEFVDPDFHHDLEFYDDHGFDQLDVADTVTTTLGATTGGVDAALYLPTGAIAGTITEAGTGAPLTNVGVAVMSTSDYHPYSATFTEPDGSYRIDALPPGDYWVVAALPVGTHEPTFVGGTHTPQGATVITVTPTATTAGADIAVTPTTGPAPTQTLQGTLTDDVTAGPKSGVLVGALRAADFGFVVATFTDAAGHYALTVPPGDYYLEFFCTRHCHEFEWYDDQPHPTSPDDLTAVTAPATADAGLTPLRGAMAGTVTDATTTLPLAGIWVAVMRATDGHGVAGTTTDASGHYTIDGLGLGDYIVVYIDPSGRHAYEFHDDATDFTHATPLTITGSHTTTADAALAPNA